MGGLQPVCFLFGAQPGFHAHQQLTVVEWLGQVIFCTYLQTFYPLVNVRPGCKHKHRDAGCLRIAFQPLTDLVAIQPGHVEIQDHEVGQVLVGHFQSFLTIGGAHYLISLHGQEIAHQLYIVLAVVRDQDCRGVSHASRDLLLLIFHLVVDFPGVHHGHEDCIAGLFVCEHGLSC